VQLKTVKINHVQHAERKTRTVLNFTKPFRMLTKTLRRSEDSMRSLFQTSPST